jgi:16S rRNA (adenine1518-N6/adenine1519-N6)-dimethyltransferase
MLRQSLKAFAASRRLDLAAALAAAGLEPMMRAEEVDVAGFAALARAAAGPAFLAETTDATRARIPSK